MLGHGPVRNLEMLGVQYYIVFWFILVGLLCGDVFFFSINAFLFPKKKRVGAGALSMLGHGPVKSLVIGNCGVFIWFLILFSRNLADDFSNAVEPRF